MCQHRENILHKGNICKGAKDNGIEESEESKLWERGMQATGAWRDMGKRRKASETMKDHGEELGLYLWAMGGHQGI